MAGGGGMGSAQGGREGSTRLSAMSPHETILYSQPAIINKTAGSFYLLLRTPTQYSALLSRSVWHGVLRPNSSRLPASRAVCQLATPSALGATALPAPAPARGNSHNSQPLVVGAVERTENVHC